MRDCSNCKDGAVFYFVRQRGRAASLQKEDVAVIGGSSPRDRLVDSKGIFAGLDFCESGLFH